jgi:hypothetical protein
VTALRVRESSPNGGVWLAYYGEPSRSKRRVLRAAANGENVSWSAGSASVDWAKRNELVETRPNVGFRVSYGITVRGVEALAYLDAYAADRGWTS